MEDAVLALIGDKKIYESDLDRIISRYPTEKRIYFETNRGRGDLLEQKVAFSVFSRYAREKGIDTSEEYIRKISDITEQILTQLVMQELFSSVSVTDEDARIFYDENLDKFVLEETVRASHILVEDESTACEIEKQIKSGETDLPAAAEKYSVCPSKEKGGDLGYFKRGMMVKEFEDAAFDMELNTISTPVKTQFGYHIIMVTDKTPKGIMDFDDVKDKLKEQLRSQKQQEIYEEKYNELKEKYGVVIN
ncbi:MAG: peptidylprolyl isomerase [Oscillospiraceae bacterium]|nr:peptidylprolyl isomerase [Oscillospiraceae bacterium]